MSKAVERMESAHVEQGKAPRGRGFQRVAVVTGAGLLPFVAAGAAFAQTSGGSTLPDATSVTTGLVNSTASSMATTAIAIIPVVVGAILLFWAINLGLSKVLPARKAKVKV